MIAPREGYKRYLPKRADKNQPEIMRTLRLLGFSVRSLHEGGRGVYDLLVSKKGLNILAEVKDGTKPPSQRVLTHPQKLFNFEWQGMRCVLTSQADCMELARQVNAILYRVGQIDIEFKVTGSPEKQYEPCLF